jgi:MFS family permease
MQPERPIALACAGIAIALVAPEFLTLTRPESAPPGTGLVVGAVLGALGVYGGSFMAAERQARSARALAFGFWILLALAFSGALFLAAVQSPTWGHRLVFGLSGILPLVGPVVVLSRKEHA